MDDRLDVSELKPLLENLNFDIKAEPFFTYFNEEKEIYYKFRNFFDRNYSDDIYDIAAPVYDEGKVQYAFLTRLGIYDILPEIFFHNQKKKPGVGHMVHHYKERKEQEKEARKFFEPIENELFHFLLEIEAQEKIILSKLSEEEVLLMLRKIWDIDHTLPVKEISKVIKFLPFMYKISGNIEAIVYILEYIFNQKITVEEKPILLEGDVRDSNSKLLLGNSFALAPLKTSYLKKYVFTMVDITDVNNIQDYFSEGKVNKILSLFLNYTLPFENDFEIRFTIPLDKQSFVLDKKPYSGRIDISTTIA